MTEEREVWGDDFERRRFDRGELIRLVLRARWLAQQPGQAPRWVRAYHRLADAADTIEALIVRAVHVKHCKAEEEAR